MSLADRLLMMFFLTASGLFVGLVLAAMATAVLE